ncbi:hypothetical protein GCM10028807_32790 [Spirosoma daeguense]
MAQEAQNEVLIQIKVSEEEVKEKMVSAREALARLRKEKAELEKEYKTGVITAKEYAKSQQAIEKQIKAASSEIKKGEKTLSDYDKVTKAAEGSLDQMRAQLPLLIAQLSPMSKEMRENSEEGQELEKTIRSITDALKEAESAYGSNQRNVGNYGDALGKVAKDTDVLTVAQHKNADAVDDNKKSVKDYIKEVNIMGINVGDVSEKFKNGTSGVGTFAKAILSTRGALIALTAVPIILVLTAIVSFFTRSKEGAELFERKIAAVTAVVNLFFSKMVSLGKAIVAAFENPGQALKDLGDLIKENLTNRVQAFSVILDAISSKDLSKLRDGFIQLFTGIKDAGRKVSELTEEARQAAVAGEAVAKQAQKIADAERKLSVERARNRAEVEKQKQLSDDVTKSNEVRLGAATRAYNIENGLLQQQLKIQQQKIENIKAENKLRGVDTKEGLDNLAEAEQRYSELKEESTTRQIELQNKLNQIRIEGERSAAELAVANAERALYLAVEAGKKTNLELGTLQEDLLKKKLTLELVGVVKGSEQEKAIRKRYQTEMAELSNNAVISELDRKNRIEASELRKRLALAKTQSDEEFNIRKGLLQRAYLEDVNAARATIKNKEELNLRLLELDKQYEKDKALIEQEARQAELNRQDEFIKQKLTKTRAGSDAEYRVLKEQRAVQLKKELDDVNKTEEQKKTIKDQFRRADEDAERDHIQNIVDQTINALSQGTATISRFIEASYTRQINALEQEQEAVLSSAALTAEQRTQLEEKFQKRKAEIEKEAAEKRRKVASIENIINTAAAVTKAFATSGPIVGAILAALAVATGIAQQVVIDNQKFASGGVYRSDGRGAYIQGPGTGKSDSINARLSNGESVLTAKATQMFYPELSRMNVAGGGRPFPNISAMMGFTPERISNIKPGYNYGGVNLGLTSNNIADAIVRGMNGVNIRVGVDAITQKQKDVYYAEVGGDT